MTLDPQTEFRLRLHIADPEPADGTGTPLLSYDDLQALYTGAGGSVERTVASALLTIAASETLVSKKIRTQDLQTDGPAVSAELRALAREWEARARALEAPADADGYIGYIPGPGARHGRHEGEEARTWWG